MLKPLDYTVYETSRSANTSKLTVRVMLTDSVPASDALNFIRSFLLKQHLAANWVAKNAPGAGVSVQGGPRPLTEVDGKVPEPKEGGYVFDPASKVIAYEQDFRITRG